MDRRDIEDFLIEYQKVSFEMIPRDLRISPSKDFITTIYGPRRSGKTFLLYSLKEDNSVYIDFDDYRLYGISFKEIRNILRIYIELFGKEPKRVLLDEIQNVKNWEVAVRSLYNLKKYEIVVTGSSSKLLSKEIATQLRGRSISYLLLPFSFKEFLRARKHKLEKLMTKDERSKIKSLLRDYLREGGFPELVLEKVPKRKWIQEYIEKIVYKDFVERYRLKNISLARFMAISLLKDSPREISVKSLFDKASGAGIKVSKDTVYEYVDKIQDTAVFFFLEKYSEKIHVRTSWPKKVYTCDTSLILRWDIGKAMETAVFLEVLRWKNEIPRLEVFYHRDPYGEVDFVITDEKKKYLLQVTYEITEENYKRELENLVKVGKELKTKNLFVITWDEGENFEISGKEIRRVALWEFLLEGKNLLKFSFLEGN